MLLSLILYGSRARGDHRQSSDVDLLGVTDAGPISREKGNRGANLYHYPVDALRTKAAEGDLFVLHLVREGKVLHDTADLFESIKAEFKFRDSYKSHYQDAACVVWYLAARKHLLSRKSIRNRFVWGVRTIIIAHAAEAGEAIFSARALEKFSGLGGLQGLINRRNTAPVDDLLSVAEAVTEKYSLSKRRLRFPGELADQAKFMRKRGGICLDTQKLAGRTTLLKSKPANASAPYGG